MITTSKISQLISPNRLDIGSKLLFIDSIISGSETLKWSQHIYLEIIKALTLDTYQEYGSDKNSPEDYVNAFKNLIEKVSINGFDPNCPIPINRDEIIGGAHRLAVAAYFNIPNVPLIQDNSIERPRYDYDFFSRRGCSNRTLLESALAISKYCTSLRVAVVWPKGHSGLREILKSIGPHYFRTQQNFSLIGLRNLVCSVYHNEEWIGDESNQFRGARSKAIDCFDTQPTTFLVYDERFSSQAFKAKIRSLMNIGKSGIHTTDDPIDSVRLMESVLPDSNLNILNCIPDEFSKSHLEFKKKLAVINEEDTDYIVDGGQILNLFGLRDSDDIDLIINPQSTLHLSDKIKKVQVRKYSSEEIYSNYRKREFCDDYFIFNGVKYLSPMKLISLKRSRLDIHGDLKDKDDIELLSTISLSDNPEFTSQRLYFYAFLRTRKQIRRVLIKIAIQFGLVWFVRKLKGK